MPIDVRTEHVDSPERQRERLRRRRAGLLRGRTRRPTTHRKRSEQREQHSSQCQTLTVSHGGLFSTGDEPLVPNLVMSLSVVETFVDRVIRGVVEIE